MKFLKVNNYRVENIFGYVEISYKGLDIDQFVPGSQVYPPEEFCLVATKELNYSRHNDLIELTEEQYRISRAEIESKNRELNNGIAEKYSNLEKQNADLTFHLMSSGVI